MRRFSVAGSVTYEFQVEILAPSAKEAARIVREDKDVGELLEEAQQQDVEIHYVAATAEKATKKEKKP